MGAADREGFRAGFLEEVQWKLRPEGCIGAGQVGIEEHGNTKAEGFLEEGTVLSKELEFQRGQEFPKSHNWEASMRPMTFNQPGFGVPCGKFYTWGN